MNEEIIEFAKAALSGLLVNANIDEETQGQGNEYYVVWAWDIAEIMVAEGKRRGHLPTQ
jgi:hypothetical protein